MIDFSALQTALYPLLNAGSSIDLIWWTAAELATYLSEAAKRLSATGAFVEESPVGVTAGGASYSLPATLLSVIAVYLDDAPVRAANVRELEAYSETWTEDSGAVNRWLLDVAGPGTMTLWPRPESDGALAVVHHAWIPASGTTRYPAVLGTAMRLTALASARAKAGDGQAQDIAAASAERARVIYEAARAYWGGAE